MIAKSKKSYNIGEKLFLPAAIKMSLIVCGKKEATEMQKISLSNNTCTVSRHISGSSDSMDKRIHSMDKRSVESCEFSIQLDESTDITNMTYALSYVRYNNSINEDLLLCQPLPERETRMDIFQTVDFFIKVCLRWKECAGVGTDGAAAMTGHAAGFYAGM